MSVGIYKINAPNGKIYVGQSINIEKRINGYKKMRYCKNQIKLYNSFLKYGILSHTFEILELCKRDDLSERERYWQDFYNVLSITGLNLKLTGSNDKTYVISNECKEKIKNSLNKYFNELGDDKKSEIYGKSCRKRKGCTGIKGRVVSEQTKNKISNANKGHIVSEVTKNKIRLKMIGRKITWNDKISKSNIGKSRNKNIGNKSVIQYDKNYCIVNKYDSITEASLITGIAFNSISNCLNNRCKTSGGFIWKYNE